MKSFFKKLAFVMALAMVVSMAAPAAKVAVAADKALAVTYQNENHYTISEVNLANVGDKEDLKFLWAPSNWKELGVKWTSSNENVVTVDPNGVVTAVAAGTADVSVAVGTETATVTVNCVDLPKYTVTMGTSAEDNNITEYTLEKVDDTIDLAFFGIKDYARDDYNGNGVSRYFCEWDTTDPEVATVDDKGLVTAVAPGKAKITLIVWNLELGKKVDVEPCWITVPEVEEPVAPVTDVVVVNNRNKTQDTVEIDLPKAGSIGLADVELFRVFRADNDENGDGVIDERDVDRPYESVYLYDVKAAGENFDLITFDDFIDGALYEIRVNGYEPVRFTASVGDVADVQVFEKSKACLATDDLALVPAYVYVKLYDANGVDVTTRVVNGVRNDDESNVTFSLTEESIKYAMTGYNEVEFYDDAIAMVEAEFDNNGKPVVSAVPLQLEPETVKTYGINKVVSWTLVNENDRPDKNKNFAFVTDWTKEVNHSVPAGEYDYIIATLLEDTRGEYFTTHENSATVNSGVKYNGKNVYYTEDWEKAFWIYGYRVEYRAMDPDKMIVEDYGEVASYEEGKARFALYLYNQNGSEDVFVKQLYSQYVNVCCPMEMTDISATPSVEITMNTEHDDDRNGITIDADNAYYSIWSKSAIEVKLLDIHTKKWNKEVLANNAEAETADFTVELLSSAMPGETKVDVNNTPSDATDDVDLYEALKDLVAEWEEELNDSDSNKRTITVEAKDFAELFAKRTLVKIKITEAVTKKTATVNITLRRPALEILNYNNDGTPNYGASAALGTIDEYTDELKTELVTFEKFKVRNDKLTVDQYKKIGTDLLLFQLDKSGKEIGVDNNLYVSKVLYTEKNGVSQVKTTDIFGATGELKVGDRVIFVKDSDGKVFGDINSVYKNPDYTSKKVWNQHSMTDEVTGLGVEIGTTDKIDNKFIKTASDDAIEVNKYDFTFVTTDDDDELVFAKEGRYTVTIKTVRKIDNDTVYFTKNTGLTDTVTITVSNSKPEVSLVKRELARVEDAYISTYFDTDTKNVAYGDDTAVKELILKAFDFTIKDADADILYYTYTVTPTNKQVVINDVVFKVQVNDLGGWYRSTAKVNKSLTFDYE